MSTLLRISKPRMSTNGEVNPNSHGGITTSITQGWALTTVFTPPTGCVTPFITVPDVGCDDITCSALFMPSLEIDSATGGAHLQCLPSFATDTDFNESPIFAYSPGLFCPSGMTTATSISGTAICCPSGLTCTDVGTDVTSCRCTATLTTGTFGQGGWGENPDIGYFSSLTVLSPKLHQTIYAEATPITLVAQNVGNNDNTSSSGVQSSDSGLISSTTVISDSTTTQPEPTSTSSPRPSSDSAIIVGGVLGAVAFIFFIALVYFFLTRYRHGRLQTRSIQSHFDTTQEHGTSRTQQNPGDSTGGFWSLKPELDPTTTRAELEGTTIDQQGPGIYVVKPELEGTVGIKRLLGVFVKGKAELEGSSPR
ncbi:hypothetical protein F5B21DRAFT_497848 [Xylaria acuta]|nr:hypothetical protein F5B21DRAFT_497848 [Xylaria acuta]